MNERKTWPTAILTTLKCTLVGKMSLKVHIYYWTEASVNFIRFSVLGLNNVTRYRNGSNLTKFPRLFWRNKEFYQNFIECKHLTGVACFFFARALSGAGNVNNMLNEKWNKMKSLHILDGFICGFCNKCHFLCNIRDSVDIVSTFLQSHQDGKCAGFRVG